MPTRTHRFRRFTNTIDTLVHREGDINLPRAMTWLENRLIAIALLREQGNHAATARALKINRTTLLQKLRKDIWLPYEKEKAYFSNLAAVRKNSIPF